MLSQPKLTDILLSKTSSLEETVILLPDFFTIQEMANRKCPQTWLKEMDSKDHDEIRGLCQRSQMKDRFFEILIETEEVMSVNSLLEKEEATQDKQLVKHLNNNSLLVFRNNCSLQLWKETIEDN